MALEKEDTMYKIYDNIEKRVVKTYTNKTRARNKCAKLNLEYGATRYTMNGVAS